MYTYSVSSVVTTTTAKDLLRISVPASPADRFLPRGWNLRILRVTVASTAVATTSQVPITFHTASTLGTASAATVVALDYAPSFTAVIGGTAATTFSVDTAKSALLYQQGVDLAFGVQWVEDEDAQDQILLPPGSNFVVRCDGAPAASTAIGVNVLFGLF